MLAPPGGTEEMTWNGTSSRPTRPGQGRPVQPPSSARPEPALAPRRVLVACSDPAVLDAIERVLRHHAAELSATGLELGRAVDGVSCLQELQLAPPDLLVVHARLDRMSGPEVLEAWDRAHPGERLPAVLLSASFGQDVPDGLEVAATLQLPFENPELLEVVGRALVRDSR